VPVPFEVAPFQALALPEAIRDAYYNWWLGEAGPGSGQGTWRDHRIGGWPTPIQDDPAFHVQVKVEGVGGENLRAASPEEVWNLSRSAQAWKLLLQVGSDDGNGMLWGDLGQVYVMIRSGDLASARFGEAYLTSSCF
jgi:hypothetical protein